MEGIIQKRRGKYAHFQDLHDRIKALEKKLSVNNNIS